MGWEIDIASPLGGNGPADPQGFYFYANDPISQQYIAKDPITGIEYVPLTQSTIPIDSVVPSHYDAIFLVGGTGAMFDFPFSVGLKNVLRSFWESGKIVSSVCHGAVAFPELILSNGDYFVEGKLITGFSNDEEQYLGTANVCFDCQLPACDPSTCYGPTMPEEYYLKRNSSAGLDPNGQASYLVETQLKLRGAKYISTYQDWVTFYFRPHVITDGRLVTGQNPGAGEETAKAVVDAVRRIAASCGETNDVVQSTFCTAIQYAPTDPPSVCATEGVDLCILNIASSSASLVHLNVIAITGLLAYLLM